ncbi:MAG: ribbon-helix-helix domain-containing protein [Spirochaetaceae bacterium]|nr:ribbon-helix-helix domain-containing protein [Spirochaetaceae bacterium]
MTSLRLPIELEQKIFSFAKTRNQSKSAVILTALEQFFEQEKEIDSFELGKNYFGRFGSGGGEKFNVADQAADGKTVPAVPAAGSLSTGYKKLLKEKILAKHSSG